MSQKQWKCPDCGVVDEYEIEEEYEDDEESGDSELIYKDIVCNNCGYREAIY